MLLFLYLYLPNAIKTQVFETTGPIDQRVIRIEAKSDSTEQRLARIEILLDGLTKSAISKDVLLSILKQTITSDPQRLRAAVPVALTALKSAEAKGITLRPEEIRDVGGPLLNRLNDPSVTQITWVMISDLVAYRSFVNGAIFPSVSAKEGQVKSGFVSSNNGTVNLT